MFRRRRICALAGVLFAASAAAESLPFDTQRSQAGFDVRVMWMFSVEGRFGEVAGDVLVDRAAQTARVTAEIDARALEMHSAGNTAWAKSPEFFDVERYPHIHFVSEPFPLSLLAAGGPIIGSLTVRGHTVATTFTLRPSTCRGTAAPDCPVSADGVIKRTDFGMRSRRGALSDRVRLHLSIVVRGAP